MDTPGTFPNVRKKDHPSVTFLRARGTETAAQKYRSGALEQSRLCSGDYGQITLIYGDVTVHFYFRRIKPA